MSALSPDYSKRDYSLPAGCKDLVDVLKHAQAKKGAGVQGNQKDFGSTFIYQVARHAGLTDHEATEVLQEVFTTVVKHLFQSGHGSNQHSIKAWLIKVVRWRIIQKFRERRDHNL